MIEKEQDIQKAIIDYLRYKHYVVFKHHSTGSTIRNNQAVFYRSGARGISDLIACSPKGRFIAIEVKRKDGKVSPDQTTFIESIINNGGVAFVAKSVDDVVDQLKEIN